jgi:hypothetical protein
MKSEGIEGDVKEREFVRGTEGCGAGDLCRLVEGARVMGKLRVLGRFGVGVGGGGGTGGEGEVRWEDVERAMKGFRAEGLKGAKVKRGGEGWEDVGGLEGVKKRLKEVFENPVRYRR